MIKRFLGLLVIGVGVTAAVTGCDTTVDHGVATVAPPTGVVDATVEPTANVSITTGLPAATVPSASFETTRATIQAIRDASLSKPQPTPIPTPVDKSGWTIIKPGECEPGMTISAGEPGKLRDLTYAFIDISWADDEAELVKMADLIIHGVPVGDIEVKPPRQPGYGSWYFQDVRILSVLRGQAPGDTVRVLQIGFGYVTQPQYLERYKITLGTGGDYGYPGPLAKCPQILFLNDPKPAYSHRSERPRGYSCWDQTD